MEGNMILGAIAGDIIGSAYEFNPTKDYNFLLFNDLSEYTDDTVMTVANAEWLLTSKDLGTTMLEYGNKYEAGYGELFLC